MEKQIEAGKREIDNEHIVIKVFYPVSDDPKLAAQAKIDWLINHSTTLFELVDYVAQAYEQKQIEERQLFNVFYTASQIGRGLVESIQDVYMEYDLFKEV